jgi:hypothetical protein
VIRSQLRKTTEVQDAGQNHSTAVSAEGAALFSDLTDGEWSLIAPYLASARRLGRPRSTDLRAVVNRQCSALHLDDGLPMAPLAKALSADLDGAALLLSMAG